MLIYIHVRKRIRSARSRPEGPYPCRRDGGCSRTRACVKGTAPPEGCGPHGRRAASRNFEDDMHTVPNVSVSLSDLLIQTLAMQRYYFL